MKKTLMNLEIEKLISVISGKDSFRNNTEIKVPGALDWSLRVNLKKLNEVYEMYNQARTEVGKKYVDAGKVEGDQVKQEYIAEYNAEIWELMIQKNEIDFRPLKVGDFMNLPLSMPEKDFLFSMCEDEEIEKYFEEEEAKESTEEPETEE